MDDKALSQEKDNAEKDNAEKDNAEKDTLEILKTRINKEKKYTKKIQNLPKEENSSPILYYGKFALAGYICKLLMFRLRL